METGSPVYENWIAHLTEPAAEVIFEFPVYSDADGVPSIRSGLGPYQVIATKREVPELVDCPSLILRIRRHVWPKSNLTGGSIPDELACLLSLLSGTRLAAGANYNRRFGFYDDDPLGEPISTHETLVVPKSVLGGSILPQVLTHRTWDPVPLETFINLSADQSVVVAKAARLYRQALWYADAQPEFCWLMLVSAAETAAGFWRKERLPPEDQVRELRPKLAKLLLDAGGDDLLRRAAVELADYIGATRKFVDFLTRFVPPADNLPDYQRDLKAIYSARSRALHSGAPIAHDLPITISAFEDIVRNALIRWWQTLPGPKGGSATNNHSGAAR